MLTTSALLNLGVLHYSLAEQSCIVNIPQNLWWIYLLFAYTWDVIAYTQTCSCVSSISFKILSKCISFIGIFLSNRVISGNSNRRNPVSLHKASEWVRYFPYLSLIRRNAFSWSITSQITKKLTFARNMWIYKQTIRDRAPSNMKIKAVIT